MKIVPTFALLLEKEVNKKVWMKKANVAQPVEQLICNQPVGGSSPSIGSFFQNNKYGEIPERPNGADCNSVDFVFGGSNPPLPTRYSKRE